MERLDRFFGIRAAGSTVRREVVGGVTTFATMSYIIFVQPTVLAFAGMDPGSVLLATCLSSALACVLMGVIARYPFALAPGMGENFLFAFAVCGSMGFSWQAGLAIVFLSGVLFVILAAFRTREKVVEVLPDALKHAIGPAIGLFIAFVGLQWSGIIIHDPATMVRLGPLTHGVPLLSLFGLLLMAVLMVRGVRGGILLGILATTGVGVLTGVLPSAGLGLGVPVSFDTFFQLDFHALLANWQSALIAIALFFFLDLFDTVGTLVGVSSQAGYLDEKGRLPRAGRAFMADALGSCAGALLGTSTVTSYIESASGVAAGARTGLAAVVTGLCFVGGIALAPVVAVVGEDVGPAYYASLGAEDLFVRMHPAVAPALILVGVLMLAPLRKVHWDDLTEALPAFLTVAIMPLGYGITEGVSAGCVSYAVIKLATGRRREAHPFFYAVAFLLILRYAFLL